MPAASRSLGASGGMLASQKHLDHLRLLDRGRELAFKDFLAGVEHDDAVGDVLDEAHQIDRKSTRLNSSHQIISYAVFCLKKKNHITIGHIACILIEHLVS